MNAGAYGGEMVQVLTAVTYLDGAGEERTLPAAECALTYRHSLFSDHPDWLVLEAELELRPGDGEAIRARMDELAAKRREVFVNDYPPVVTEKLRALGIVAEKPPARKSDILRKLIAVVVFALVIALALRRFNGITTFSQAALTAYLLWLVVDWYDFLVVDILMAPFDKFYRLAKVSPVEKSAVWFHCKASLRGMVLGLVFAPLVGLIVLFL